MSTGEEQVATTPPGAVVRRRRGAYSVTLKGPQRLSDLSIREIATFLDGLAALVAHGAAADLGRRMRATGRYQAALEDASRLRLARLSSGSVRADLLEPAPRQAPPGFGLAADTLSARSFRRLMSVASNPEARPEDADVVAEFDAYLTRVIGDRHDWTLRLADNHPARPTIVVVDRPQRDRIHRAAVVGSLRHVSGHEVTGRVFEVNYERRTALVRTSAATDPVLVQFGPEHDDEVLRQLRHLATVRGDVTFDPRTQRVIRIELQEIHRGDQLGLDFGGVDFWVDRPVHDLIAAAGARQIEDPAVLELHGIPEEDWQALYEVLAGGH